MRVGLIGLGFHHHRLMVQELIRLHECEIVFTCSLKEAEKKVSQFDANNAVNIISRLEMPEPTTIDSSFKGHHNNKPWYSQFDKKRKRKR